MPAVTTNDFATAAACYACLSAHDRFAFRIYLRVLELAAAEGTDYTAELGSGGQLSLDAAELLIDSRADHELALLVVQADNATAAGATVPTDIQDISEAIACLVCYDTATLKAMDLLLERTLGPHTG